MKLLILGGTVFLGRHIAEAALARGHNVTLFNRGRHAPDLFPEAEKLRGDRDGDLSALQGRTFDAVIDTSGYRPEQVRTVVNALAGRDPHYTFISSISVYRGFPPGRSYDAGDPLAEGNEGYGALKARCEEALEAKLPGGVAHVRPGLIAGPYDPTDRFTYWPRRISQGGEVLAPGRPERPVQLIDARDLADWCVRLAETRTTGAFNAVGPAARLTMGEVLEACREITPGAARLTWVPDANLVAAGVNAWTEMPLWIPENDPGYGGMLLGSNEGAVAAGLRFRPIAETIRATLAWDVREGGPRSEPPLRVIPISREREAAILAAVCGIPPKK